MGNTFETQSQSPLIFFVLIKANIFGLVIDLIGLLLIFN